MSFWAGVMIVAGGLFAGGAATFAWSRIPIWRRMHPTEFVDDFSQTIHVTDKVQPALLVAAIVASIGFALTEGGTARVLALLGGGGFLVTLIASVAVLVPLQRRIIRSGQPQPIEEMRLRWFRGHLGRSVLSVVAFAVTTISVTA